jgi:exopolysaccharide biosynthesis protein
VQEYLIMHLDRVGEFVSEAAGMSNCNKVRKYKWRKILAFLIFELLFSSLTMPILVFYGPFENIKRTVTGASWNTLAHQYIAEAFLSDEAIARILGESYAVDPTDSGKIIQTLNFGNKHTDRIDVYNIESKDFTGKLMVIYDPTRIEVGYSVHMPRSGETTSAIAKRNKAAGAINAGGFLDQGWTGTGGAPMGFIIHEGKVVYNQLESEDARQETVAFTDRGMLIVGKHSISQLKEYGTKEGVSFGPPLIVNGKPTITKGDGGWGIAPRTAIGQRENGEVLLLTIDGRNIKSFGATLKEVQDILLSYGAVNAANLDGGSSTTMYFNGNVINNPSDKLGERTVPTAFLVMPAKEGDV